tara:strand:+ start:8044 stop:8436 length:393 start_codon:yes stop_codon:yes gene_type:complete
MPSVFSRIIKGDLPSYNVHEDKLHLAFLDIAPLQKGHVLVIPKKEIDYIFDLNDSQYKALWNFARIVAKKMKKALNCKRIGIAVIGFEVMHVHIHLVPINSIEDMNFSKKKLTIPNNEMKEIANLIKETI